MSENSNKTGDADSSNIKTKQVVAVLCLIVLLVLGFYLYKFRFGLSSDTGDWGTFGDYVGGILNPVIAAFAFYLIAKTYELQKRELEATRGLLKVSTDAQEKQIKLAALTALLNSNLMKIDTLRSESFVYKGKLPLPEGKTIKELVGSVTDHLANMKINPGLDNIYDRLGEIKNEIEKLELENVHLEMQIKGYLKRTI